jgi:tripartite-type tricarboxylate transporter receptor subunit TctC
MSKPCAHFIRRGLWAAAFFLAGATQAQTYPARTITLVVPYPAGGGTDTVARIVAEKMRPALGQNIVIDNRGGASGIVGTDMVAKAAPDGHTLVVSLSTSLLINKFLFKKLPYDPQKDLAMVSQIALAPIMLVVNEKVPVRNVAELKTYLVANKGKLSYGSWGIGSSAHLTGAHLSKVLDADMTHVPYKGGAPLIQDLVGGQIPLSFVGIAEAKPFIDAGKLRPIGITGETRVNFFPNVPTLAEQGLQDDVFRIVGWIGLAAPAATPKAIQQRIADEVRAAVKLPDVRARFESFGMDPVARGPEEFAAAYRKDMPVWQQVVKASGATLD